MARNYTPKDPREGGLTPEQVNARKQSQFARVLLENGGFVERAIRECHTSRRWLNEQLDNDHEFAALYQAIRDQNNERIEEEIYRRAILGNEKELVHQGYKTGETVREYSDNLLMFYAKANMPGKYRDLPQKGGDLTEAELDERITAWMRKRKEAEEASTMVN
jgi:hypothetical protein